jgi:putative methionine-R-sulfoxide reductase with GAF domain
MDMGAGQSSETKPNEKQILAAIADLQRQVLGGKLDSQSALTAIAEQVRQFTGATGSTIGVVEDQDVIYKAAAGDLAGLAKMRMKTASAMICQCLRKGKVVACDDLEELDLPIDLAGTGHVGSRSFLAVPVLRHGVAIAAIEAVSTMPNAFTPEHVSALELLAPVVRFALSRGTEAEIQNRMANERAAIQDALTALTAIHDHLISAAKRTQGAELSSEPSLDAIETALTQLKTMAANRGIPLPSDSTPRGPAPSRELIRSEVADEDTPEYLSNPEAYLEGAMRNQQPPVNTSGTSTPGNRSFQTKLGGFILRSGTTMQPETDASSEELNGNSQSENNNQERTDNIRTEPEP